MDETAAPSPLTGRELAELTSAAAWYARHHAHLIAERANDHSAPAEAQRLRYASLLSALEKLGTRLGDPAAATDERPSVADDLSAVIRRAA